MIGLAGQDVVVVFGVASVSEGQDRGLHEAPAVGDVTVLLADGHGQIRHLV